jgi:hypothetical protein
LAARKAKIMANWIKGAIKHPGALHKQLGVPQGQKIPASKLASAAKSSNPLLRKRAILAKTLKKMHGKGGKKDGKGGLVVPATLGAKAISKFSPSATAKGFEAWSGTKLAESALPKFAVKQSIKRVGALGGAVAGAIDIGRLGSGLYKYGKELKAQTKSVSDSGKLQAKRLVAMKAAKSAGKTYKANVLP